MPSIDAKILWRFVADIAVATASWIETEDIVRVVVLTIGSIITFV